MEDDDGSSSSVDQFKGGDALLEPVRLTAKYHCVTWPEGLNSEAFSVRI